MDRRFLGLLKSCLANNVPNYWLVFRSTLNKGGQLSNNIADVINRPRNPLTSSFILGAGISIMAFTLLGRFRFLASL